MTTGCRAAHGLFLPDSHGTADATSGARAVTIALHIERGAVKIHAKIQSMLYIL